MHNQIMQYNYNISSNISAANNIRNREIYQMIIREVHGRLERPGTRSLSMDLIHIHGQQHVHGYKSSP